MIVTVNTDASFNNRFKIGSYAFWIVCDEHRFNKSGVFKQNVGKATIAEMRCIYNCLYFLAKKYRTDGLFKRKIEHIIVNTDSMNSIHVFSDDTYNRKCYHLMSKQYQGLLDRLNKLQKKEFANVKIEFRHVKAHTTTSTKRTWVNDWCDTECKKHMKKVLDKKFAQLRVQEGLNNNNKP